MTESSFGWVIHRMWVCDHFVVLLLPDAVVGNTSVHVQTIVPMDSVSVDTMKQVVAYEYLLISQVFFAFNVLYLY